MAFVNEKSEIPSKNRTVDYERDAVLKGGAENIRYPRVPYSQAFTLTWKGEKIEFGTRFKIEALAPDGSKGRMTYYIEKCVYPEHLRAHKAEIIQMILEAVHTYGVCYGTREGTEIVVKIMPGLGNLQMEPLHELPPSPSDESRRLL